MKVKKYYTIGEVTKVLRISASQLRYLESVLSTLNVLQVKGRRYYTQTNINVIQNKLLGSNRNIDNQLEKPSFASNTLSQVEDLISKFYILASKIKEDLALVN